MWVCPICGESANDPGKCPRDGVAREDGAQDPLLGVTLGSFRVTTLIGAGGMGRVYRGVQPSIGARVAIKFLAAGSDEESVERFFGEARTVNTIRHEHIVRVLDLATYEGKPYIVMEHLEGAPLSKLLKSGARLPLGGLLLLVREVLEAIEAAHARGVIHRDLKPDNVFVTPGGHAKVLDFGIAKLAPDDPSAGLTRTGALMGTPKYMSPEQAMAMPVDARADLYSMGVILYQACTGVPPFTGDPYAIMEQHVAATPVPLRARRPDLPEALEALVLRALAKRPEHRFQSAREMIAAIDEVARALHGDEQVRIRVEGEGSNAPVAKVVAPAIATATAGTFTAATTGAGAVAPPKPRSTGLAIALAALVAILVAGGGLAVWFVAIGPSERVDHASKLGEKESPKAKPSSTKEATANAGGDDDDDEPPGAEGDWTPIENIAADDPALPGPPDFTDFDVVGWLPSARSIVSRKAPGLVVSMISADAGPDGHVDLAGHGDLLTYIFVSKDRAKKASPKRLEGCYFAFGAGKWGFGLSVQTLSDCGKPQLPDPKCTIPQIVARAMAKGFPKARVHVNYLADDLDGRPIWQVTTKDSSLSAHFADDCK